MSRAAPIALGVLERPDDHPDGPQSCKIAVWIQHDPNAGAGASAAAGGAGNYNVGVEKRKPDSWVGEVVLPLKAMVEGVIKADWRKGRRSAWGWRRRRRKILPTCLEAMTQQKTKMCCFRSAGAETRAANCNHVVDFLVQ